MDQLDSSDQTDYNGFEYHWLQVVAYQGAPQLRIDGALFNVYGYQKFRRAKDHPFTRLELVPNGGRVAVIIGAWNEEADVAQQGGALLGATNTATNELDSGPLSVAAGGASTRIVLANAARTRGVTIQNVGLTAIAVGKSAALAQAGLAGGGYILNADSAANAGNGGSVVFDGWQGEVWAVNVAGGPGSVLVSAF